MAYCSSTCELFQSESVVSVQQKMKKRIAYIPVLLANWLVFLLIDISTTGLSTDIVDGVCVPYVNSVAVQQAMGYYILLMMYLLPLTLIIFCYSRIVYTLRTKVTGDGRYLPIDSRVLHDICPQNISPNFFRVIIAPSPPFSCAYGT